MQRFQMNFQGPFSPKDNSLNIFVFVVKFTACRWVCVSPNIEIDAV